MELPCEDGKIVKTGDGQWKMRNDIWEVEFG